jgi:hypothetical protein
MYSLVKCKKSPYYQLVYIQESGKRTSISTHCNIKSDALKFLTQFKEKLREATKPAVITLKDFNVQYEEFSIMKHSKNYLRSYKSAYKILLTEFSKDIVMNKLNVTDLERFFLQRFSESKFGAHLNYRTLKAALEKAVEWNYLSTNPLKKIKMPKLPQKNVLIINHEDFQAILAQEPNITLMRL